MFNVNYNPDVLNCIANLSSDEVFTSPTLANSMLDKLPKSLWKNKNSKFLDPCTKSGVFLREITKRLILGLEKEIPNLEKRINHILKNQVFGIATTELTSLIARRSLYCSKNAKNKYSIASIFNNEEGNIRYDEDKHIWKDEVCIYCGANKRILGRGNKYESYAYQFIHQNNLFKENQMKFDVIIGNPPYQLNVGVEKKNYAILIFHKFVEMAISLKPSYVSMIIPSRWFTGGRGIDGFRDKMLKDKRIKEMVDYPDSRDCFNGVEVAGGAMYFLWDKNYDGDCKFTSMLNGNESTTIRNLAKRHIFTRYNDADIIIDKVIKNNKSGKMLSEIVGPQTPFGLHTNFWDKDKPGKNDIEVYTSKGLTYTSKNNVTSGRDLIDLYKVIFSKATSEHAGQADKSGKRRIFSKIEIIKPNTICTQSYLVAGSFKTLKQAKNLSTYLKTRFVRFMLFQALTSQDISREKFCFVPQVDFEKEIKDKELFKTFKLDTNEISIIEELIKNFDE
jgi:site-specific DNA-methyltransferase (adenine-specific)